MRVVADLKVTILPREAREDEGEDHLDTHGSTQSTENDDYDPNVLAYKVQNMMERIRLDKG
jgi:hypothetical protein